MKRMLIVIWETTIESTKWFEMSEYIIGGSVLKTKLTLLSLHHLDKNDKKRTERHAPHTTIGGKR